MRQHITQLVRVVGTAKMPSFCSLKVHTSLTFKTSHLSESSHLWSVKCFPLIGISTSPKTKVKILSVVVHACNPSSEEVETGGSLGFTSQANLLSEL